MDQIYEDYKLMDIGITGERLERILTKQNCVQFAVGKELKDLSLKHLTCLRSHFQYVKKHATESRRIERAENLLGDLRREFGRRQREKSETEKTELEGQDGTEATTIPG